MLRLIFSIIFLFFLVFFALFNRGDMEVVLLPKYLVLSGPVFMWVYIAFALGLLFSNIFYSAKFIKYFMHEKKLKGKLEKLEKQQDMVE